MNWFANEFAGFQSWDSVIVVPVAGLAIILNASILLWNQNGDHTSSSPHLDLPEEVCGARSHSDMTSKKDIKRLNFGIAGMHLLCSLPGAVGSVTSSRRRPSVTPRLRFYWLCSCSCVPHLFCCHRNQRTEASEEGRLLKSKLDATGQSVEIENTST